LPYEVPHKAHSSGVYRCSLPVEEGGKEGRNRIRINRMFRIRCAKLQDVNGKSCITIRPILNPYFATRILMFQDRLMCGTSSNESAAYLLPTLTNSSLATPVFPLCFL